MSGVYTVLLAAALGFAVWILQRAFHRAEEQRRVASRLRAYLIFWEKRAMALDVWQVLHIGQQWYDEDQAVMRSAGSRNEITQKLVDNEKKYQTEMGETIKAELAKQKAHVEGLSETQAAIERMRRRGPEARRDGIGQAIQTRKELMEGHAFVSDNDLAVLDTPTLMRAVELRLTLAGLLEQAVAFMQTTSVLEEGRILESFKSQLCYAVLGGVRAGYAMKFLTVRCDYFLKRRKRDAVRANLFY